MQCHDELCGSYSWYLCTPHLTLRKPGIRLYGNRQLCQRLFQLSRPFRDLPVWQSAEGAFLVLFVLCVVAIELCSRRFYISQFSYVIPVMAYTICAMHGFFSAVVWASQGVLLGENSNDNDRGRKSGFFLAVYMLGSV